ncbi:MAG: ribonuclease P protein component [Candidatus Paceibacterota bacterium]|jgi:ribonuclease P protein component
MLSKKQRLSRKEAEALKNGRSVVRTLISMRFIPAQGTRISVSVSKKVSPSAVVRNRIRRRTYATLSPLLASISQDASIMLFPKKEFYSMSVEEMKAALADILGKSGLGRFQ